MATVFRKLVLLAILGSHCMVLCDTDVIHKSTDATVHTVIEEDKPDITGRGGKQYCKAVGDSSCTEIPENLPTEHLGYTSDNILHVETNEIVKNTESENHLKEASTNTHMNTKYDKTGDSIDRTQMKSNVINEEYNEIDQTVHKAEHKSKSMGGVDGVDESATAGANGVEVLVASADQSPTDEKEQVKDEAETNIPLAVEGEQNSTIFSWLRYLIEPFIEEFREGISIKTPDTGNTTDVNVSSSEADKSVSTLFNVTAEIETQTSNATASTNSSETTKKVKFQCTARNVTDNTSVAVSVVSSSRLLQLLSFDRNETENITDCLVVMFYAPWCHFCAETAPHYNALARAFPTLEFVAVDTAQFSNLLARFGTVSVPNILVFHQSRAAVKFNQTERTFENFVSFVRNSTGLEPNATVNITDTDYVGPLPSVPTDDPDYLLWIAWTFVVFYSSCMFVKSNRGQQWIMRVRVLWQEHQHID